MHANTSQRMKKNFLEVNVALKHNEKAVQNNIALPFGISAPCVHLTMDLFPVATPLAATTLTKFESRHVPATCRLYAEYGGV